MLDTGWSHLPRVELLPQPPSDERKNAAQAYRQKQLATGSSFGFSTGQGSRVTGPSEEFEA